MGSSSSGIWRKEPRSHLRGHSDRVFTVVFSADGKRLLSAGTDAARLWDVATGREERVLRHDGFLVHAGIFAPDGQFVLTGGWDGSARLWDLSTGKQIWRIEGPGVDCLAYSPGTDMLAACGHAEDPARGTGLPEMH